MPLEANDEARRIQVPAPTPWPMVTAFGLMLLAAGLVTHIVVSVVGLILALRGAIGWFRDVLPVEKTEWIPLEAPREALAVQPSPRSAAHLRAGEAGHRVRIPEEYHPYSAGLIGGIFGGVAMAIIACAYGA